MASSADIYTAPSEASYLLATPFYMPLDGKTVWAVAFSSRSGALVTAALSVMLTVSFLCLWNFLCFIALLCSSKPSRRRFAALVVLWNSNDALFAFSKLMHYTFHYRGNRSDFAFGLVWTLVSLIAFGGSLALGVVGPSLVQIGTAAPARPELTFYPVDPREGDSTGLLKVFGLRASSYLRALGSVEAADVTKRKDIDISRDPQLPSHGDEPMMRLNYSYSITGGDFGLQHGSLLSLIVNGSCVTEYGWINSKGDPEFDNYNLWGDPNKVFQVPLDSVSIQNAPKASFIYHPDAEQQHKDTGNLSFAIVVWAAHRASISDSRSDPWYATEGGQQDYTVPFGAPFWVKRGRPALSCWQQDRWRYGDHEAKTVYGLRDLPGVTVPRALLDVLEVAVSVPMLVTLGNACGDSALRSRTTSPNGVIDASASSIRSDLERLILASYVATQNVFLDTTMFQHDGSWDNVLEGGNKLPLDGAGDFVIVTPEIQTFSMVGLIVVAAVLGALLVVESGVTALIRLHQQPSDGEKAGNRLIRFKVLSALDLFRRIYEPGGGKQHARWGCDVEYPDAEDEEKFGLDKCACADRKRWCRGHVSGEVKATVEEHGVNDGTESKKNDAASATTEVPSPRA